jgi:adenylosuccinate lyase
VKGLQVYPQQMKRNIGLTKGLIFSQRVMLALVDKGLSRQKAYQLVQRNAMKVLKGNKNFLTLLKADPEVTASLTQEELEPLFDEQYYLRYVDSIYKRLGLTKSQWKGKASLDEDHGLAPRAI